MFRHISLEEAKVCCRLEEEFQVEIWGLVEGGHDMDRLNASVNLSSMGLFVGLLHDASSMQKLIRSWQDETETEK